MNTKVSFLIRFVLIGCFALSLIRLNVVSGITPEDLASWGWKQTIVRGCDVPVINFPDFQGRLFRNSPEIRWVRPVHEAISGNVTYAYLPVTAEHSILHIKSIERQREQNARYHLLMRERAGQS